MTEVIRSVCVLSMIFGVILHICPDNSVKQVTRLLATSILILIIMESFSEFDWDRYDLELTKLRQREAMLEIQGNELSSSLDRSVIQEQYETYIVDKAQEAGFQIEEIHVQVAWNMDQIWVPQALRGSGRGNAETLSRLMDVIAADLGIPLSNQEWSIHEELENSTS